MTFATAQTYYRQEGQALTFSSGKNRLEAAYESYADMLYRLALSHLGNCEDAEDAVQDVFARYITHAPVFSSAEHERAWLIRVTVNRCHDLARRRALRLTDQLNEQHDLPARQEDTASELLELLSGISEKYRTVIVLHYLEGFSVEETAEMLRLSPSAVKMRLARGRAALESLLEKESDNV